MASKTPELVWVRASREGLKVPLATDAGPEYFDHSVQRKFARVPKTTYVVRRLRDKNLIEATPAEVKQLESGAFEYPPLPEPAPQEG